jgi:hypothetical protein
LGLSGSLGESGIPVFKLPSRRNALSAPLNHFLDGHLTKPDLTPIFSILLWHCSVPGLMKAPMVVPIPMFVIPSLSGSPIGPEPIDAVLTLPRKEGPPDAPALPKPAAWHKAGTMTIIRVIIKIFLTICFLLFS